MTFSEFDKLFEDTLLRIRFLKENKGKEYANTDKDRLANFKCIAEEVGITPEQVMAVYVKKHSRAIDNYCKTGKSKSNETIEQRVIDRILYDFLFLGLIKDSKGAKLNERTNKRSPSGQRSRRVGGKTKRKRLK